MSADLNAAWLKTFTECPECEYATDEDTRILWLHPGGYIWYLCFDHYHAVSKDPWRCVSEADQAGMIRDSVVKPHKCPDCGMSYDAPEAMYRKTGNTHCHHPHWDEGWG
jgi:predicted RNA-binding Zn-ribbon protein involved in translation (DUF1610 family)